MRHIPVRWLSTLLIACLLLSTPFALTEAVEPVVTETEAFDPSDAQKAFGADIASPYDLDIEVEIPELPGSTALSPSGSIDGPDVLTLPEGLKVVEAEAFALNPSLNEVIVPDSVTRIESRAFASSSVRRVSLPESLEYLAEDAFDGCYHNPVISYRGGPSADTYGIFGIEFARDAANPAMKRVYDAEGMNYGQQTHRTIVYSDFDSAFPWCEMRECNVTVDKSGAKTILYSDESGFSRTKRDTFIEVPAFYFRRTIVDGIEQWAVSGMPFDGAEIEPWFLNDDGSIAAHRYIGRYEGAPVSTGAVSISGVYPDVRQGCAAYQKHCKSLGFQLMSIEAYLALTHLITIETGTFYTQGINSGISFLPYSMDRSKWNVAQNTALGNTVVLPKEQRLAKVNVGDTIYLSNNHAQDISDPRIVLSITIGKKSNTIEFSGSPFNIIAQTTRCFPAIQLTGGTDVVAYCNGRPLKNRLNSPFHYRGIENIYGNVWEFTSGIKWNYSTLKFDIGGVETSFTAPYQPDTGTDRMSNGFIKTFGYDERMPWATLPETVGGEPKTYITDEWHTFRQSDGQTFAVGGGWDHQNATGMFNFRTNTDTYFKHWLYGYRAML